MLIQRRRLFTGLAGLFIAPAIVKAENIMRVSQPKIITSYRTPIVFRFDYGKWDLGSEIGKAWSRSMFEASQRNATPSIYTIWR
jgi:hypothetical protein